MGTGGKETGHVDLEEEGDLLAGKEEDHPTKGKTGKLTKDPKG